MADARSRRVTSADVARAAGVSRATVSYVLNDTPHQSIPAQTRRRVLDAATELGYAPSAAARTLRSGRSEVVLCLLPDWPVGTEVGSLLSNLSTALATHGLAFVAHPAARGDRPMAQLWKAITPAAVLAFEDFAEQEIAAMRAAGVALVTLLGRSPDMQGPQQRIGRLQVGHLAAAGHTVLGYAQTDDPRVEIFAAPRIAGARAEAAERGLASPVAHPVPLEPEAAEAVVRRWRAQGVTAVCAYNDDVALAVLAGLRRCGLAAPTDLAVIGVDDIPAARLAAPPLSTVTTAQVAVAARLAETIVSAIQSRSGPAALGADVVTVVPRAST